MEPSTAAVQTPETAWREALNVRDCSAPSARYIWELETKKAPGGITEVGTNAELVQLASVK